MYCWALHSLYVHMGKHAVCAAQAHAEVIDPPDPLGEVSVLCFASTTCDKYTHVWCAAPAGGEESRATKPVQGGSSFPKPDQEGLVPLFWKSNHLLCICYC